MNRLFHSRNSTLDSLLPPGSLGPGWRAGRPAFEVFRWLLSACLAAGFAFHLSAGEPSLSATNAAAKSAAPASAHPDRALTQRDLRQLLTAALQRGYVQNRGELELEFSQPWKTIQVPDVPLSMKILDLPSSGVTSYFILRFELRDGARSLGTFQVPLQAHIWRKVWVARSPLSRGELVADADLAQERRDVLSIHEPLAEFSAGDPALEVANSLPAGADKRASNIGDILTVVVQENTTANKNTETKTDRQSSLNAAISSSLYSPTASGLLTQNGQLPAVAFTSDHKQDGSGSINNSESIVSCVAVRVIDVLPNGNLVVEGRREIAFGDEHQTMILHGVVRQDDVSANNTVYIYNVADASIQIIGKGPITDSTRRGWFNRIWDKINPF